MKFNKTFIGLLGLLALLASSGCGGGNDETSNSPTPQNTPKNGTSLDPMSGDNVLPMTVNGSECASGSYVNKPCVTVRVCSPSDPNLCQDISDVLVDSGSVGLRVFKSVLSTELANSLNLVPKGGGNLAECVQYGDGSANWGPVANANVVLGNEPATAARIQLIQADYSVKPNTCPSPDSSPEEGGFNAILGVGLYQEDCGSPCASLTNNRVYFACNSTNCATTTATLNEQVQNPIALLPGDNNGSLFRLPSVSSGGQAFANGYLVLGIGTRDNNQPSDVTSFPANASTGKFITQYAGSNYDAFLDSGSNGLFFSPPSSATIPSCSQSSPSFTGWFCPTSLLNLQGTTIGFSGSPQAIVPFQIGNTISLTQSGNSVFVDLGGEYGGNDFDWGLPMFLGRNVFVGIEDKTSSLGTGPYWAY